MITFGNFKSSREWHPKLLYHQIDYSEELIQYCGNVHQFYSEAIVALMKEELESMYLHH